MISLPLLLLVAGVLAGCALPLTPAAPPTASQRKSPCCPLMMDPGIPRQALTQGISGTVAVEARFVGGVAVDVKIVSGPEVFHESVIAAIKQYRCRPGFNATLHEEFAFKVE